MIIPRNLIDIFVLPAGIKNNEMKEVQKYKAFAIAKDGTKTLIEADSIIIELEDEIEISLLPPHPAFQGKLTLAAGSAIVGREEERATAVQLIIEPGASNLIHISPKRINS
ncbi:hypothetical protein [Chryseobacterium sp.]|uniref:hypothetical protein n=1 Tax=Chryseobacterium sp. TaxID=1871047 RepID=UPI0025C0557C|nr:hypothetical protein [Chryseobacterium sp.]MBV8327284.1 hypothetical protein [Chryseobacterium sp.]